MKLSLRLAMEAVFSDVSLVAGGATVDKFDRDKGLV